MIWRVKLSIAETRIASTSPQQKRPGLLSHNEAIELFKSMQGEVEHKQYVSGRVLKVYSTQEDLPTRTRKDGVSTYAWEFHGNLDVKLNYNQKVVTNVGPLCSHFNCMPLVDEEVVLVEHDGQVFYDFPLNRMGKVNHNRSDKVIGEERVVESTTYMARPVMSTHGDTTIQGRFGNYMMFTSEPEVNGYRSYPKIVIGNNQDKDTLQVGHKNYDKHFPHFHEPNSMGSVIEMTSNPQQADLEPSALEEEQEEFFDTTGDTITISSDTIHINSNSPGSMYVTSADSISMTAMDEINLATIGGRVNLGSSNTQSPIVKGTAMRNFINDLLINIEGFCNTLATFEGDGSAQIQTAADSLKAGITSMSKKYIQEENLFSKKVYSE
tara:strand:- start:618 stop:1760 length:1143 start_codon:yes stop_codon:yes gene_type:complete